jgi:hypothetical protein
MTGSRTVSLICTGSRANLPRLGATTHGDGQNWMSRPPLSFQVLATLTLPLLTRTIRLLWSLALSADSVVS